MRQNNDKQNLSVINFIKSIYNNKFIPLHEPRFLGNEKKYLSECIESTFVSSVGKFVNEFEEKIAKYTGSKYAIATVNGTSALHISLLLADVNKDSEVITQPLTFVATCNAISYCNAKPIFVDVDEKSHLMDVSDLKNKLSHQSKWKKSIFNVYKDAELPLNWTKELKETCSKYNIDYFTAPYDLEMLPHLNKFVPAWKVIPSLNVPSKIFNPPHDVVSDILLISASNCAASA